MKLNVCPPWTIPLLAVLLLRVSAALGAEGGTPPLEVVGEEAYGAMSRFYDYDRGIPLEAHVLEKEETLTTVRYKIVFRGVRGFLVPSYHELPVDRDGPFPCVLLMHGWSGSKQSWWQDDGYISGGPLPRRLRPAHPHS